MEERIGCWKRLEVLGVYICGRKEGLFLSEFTFSYSTPSKLGRGGGVGGRGGEVTPCLN